MPGHGVCSGRENRGSWHMQTNDTIAAIATPPGKGGVGIIRLSGPQAATIARVFLGKLPQPRYATFCAFKHENGELIDHGLAIFFAAPQSFTGEDVLELHGHGGPMVMDLLLKRVLEFDVRPARPGEFSERAFLNNKIDLAEAEAIADLIDSASAQAAKLAVKSLAGHFSKHINQLKDRLIAIRTYVEAAIDFPEEEIDFLSDKKLKTDLETLLQDVADTVNSARQGNVIREGLTVVITGQPNVGKSTLLNQLTGQDTAIVTDIPGTTRDVLRAEINIDGLPVHLVDTAGVRESHNKIEIEGIKRTWFELERCDVVILMVDINRGLDQQERELIDKLPQGVGLIILYNKIDLTQQSPRVSEGEFATEILLSARSGDGITLLCEQIKQQAGMVDATEGHFMARRRHVNALEHAENAIRSGMTQLLEHGAGELLAAELQQAQQNLGQITGEYTTEDLLGNIFSHFCIGK